ncbi:hypothetical protein GLE_1630 [Lysobacter enzymogenes]|uniref:Uncharacterized protein n=1 Tax=Lysobacter enzymogenes TaxID=69 RepID=A0A0S2DEB9_LYSEN|nr:hypothetical protein GLE_1630 [Lysobacter enzymogenes]
MVAGSHRGGGGAIGGRRNAAGGDEAALARDGTGRVFPLRNPHPRHSGESRNPF